MEKENNFIKALKIIKEDMVEAMNEGIEDAPEHEFSEDFEKKMEKLFEETKNT